MVRYHSYLVENFNPHNMLPLSKRQRWKQLRKNELKFPGYCSQQQFMARLASWFVYGSKIFIFSRGWAMDIRVRKRYGNNVDKRRKILHCCNWLILFKHVFHERNVEKDHSLGMGYIKHNLNTRISIFHIYMKYLLISDLSILIRSRDRDLHETDIAPIHTTRKCHGVTIYFRILIGFWFVFFIPFSFFCIV